MQPVTYSSNRPCLQFRGPAVSCAYMLCLTRCVAKYHTLLADQCACIELSIHDLLSKLHELGLWHLLKALQGCEVGGQLEHVSLRAACWLLDQQPAEVLSLVQQVALQGAHQALKDAAVHDDHLQPKAASLNLHCYYLGFAQLYL